MSEHRNATDQLRLGIVAALVGDDPQGQADSAASDELSLAQGLRGPAGQSADEAARAIAELLGLADGTAAAGALAVGLRQAFLIPDDSQHAPAREERTAAFADVYRRLALPELAGAARDRAHALLGALASS